MHGNFANPPADLCSDVTKPLALQPQFITSKRWSIWLS
jgi:hypothetical protein